jgi:hypothetical protein
MLNVKSGCFGLICVLGISGCAPQKSVMNLDLQDSHADGGQIHLNLERSSTQVIQLEIDHTNARDDFLLLGATNESGQGEQRLLDLEQKDFEQHALVGPGEVKSSHKIQRINARMIFKLDDSGRFQFSLAPQINFLHLNSHYSVSGQSLNFNMDKMGVGIYANMKFPLYKTLSLNISENRIFYEGSADDSVFAIYFRIEPAANWYVDLGRYRNFLDLGKDMNISYEQKVSTTIGCYENCTYAYDGEHGSSVELAAEGYRLGFGWNF